MCVVAADTVYADLPVAGFCWAEVVHCQIQVGMLGTSSELPVAAAVEDLVGKVQEVTFHHVHDHHHEPAVEGRESQEDLADSDEQELEAL